MEVHKGRSCRRTPKRLPRFALFDHFAPDGYQSYLSSLKSDWETNRRGYGDASAADMFALALDVARYRGKNAKRLWDAGTQTKRKPVDPDIFKNCRVLQKYGAITVEGSQVYHDMVIVEKNGKRYVLLIMSDYPPGKAGREAMETIAEYMWSALGN